MASLKKLLLAELFMAVALVVATAACSGASPVPITTPVPPTSTSQPVRTSTPSPTQSPRPEQRPTATPTVSASPTNTPQPIPTPTVITVPSPSPLPTPTPSKKYQRQFNDIAKLDRLTVAAFYYQWYGSPPGRLHWREGYAGNPVLGEYDSTDLNVINQHIDWATGHGIDAFNMTWWGPGHYTDGRLKRFLQADLTNEIQFSIVYESRGRLKEENVSFDMDDQHNVQRIVDDFDYLSRNYFSHPSYMKVDGKPVAFVYLARIMKGDVKGAMDKVRKKVRENGSDVFLVGDVVYWQDPLDASQIALSRAFDGIGPYNMHSSERNIADDFSGRVDRKFRQWKNMADANNLVFIPNAAPGYDDRAVRPQANNPPLPRSTELFSRQLASGLSMLGNRGIIYITTFNEWHEDTQIEPSAEYGLDYLKALASGIGHPVNK